MKPLLTLTETTGCRYSVASGSERADLLGFPIATHFFCDAPRTHGSYCAKHHRVCHTGSTGADWRKLAGMMKATEHTVIDNGSRSAASPSDKHEIFEMENVPEVLTAVEVRREEATT